MSRVLSKKGNKNIDTKILNLGKLDPQSCAEVNGEITENKDCIAKKKTNAADPNHVVFEKMHYQKPPTAVRE